MSEKLKDIYKGKFIGDLDGVVAIEIEAESYEEVKPAAEGWVTADDGSLRYFGLEFKSRNPVKEAKLREHLDTLKTAVSKVRFVENSPRTSVHVHVNVTGLTPSEIWTAVTAGWLLEPAMFKMCDPMRAGNLFCLRLQDAKGLFDLIEMDIENSFATGKGALPFQQFRGNNYRYSNFNLASITKFGSIEVRALHGTFDVDLIETWAKMCIGIVHRSKQFGTPQNLFDFVLNKGYGTFTKTVLGDSIAAKLPEISNDEFEEQIDRLVPMILLCDWNDYAKLSWANNKPVKKDKLGGEWDAIQRAALRGNNPVPVDLEVDNGEL